MTALAQEIDRRVVVHLAFGDHTTVAVVGVLAQADVRDDDQVGQVLFDLTYCLRNNAVVQVGIGPFRILMLGNPEQNHGRNPEIAHHPALLESLVYRHLRYSGHRCDGLLHPLAGYDEEWQK